MPQRKTEGTQIRSEIYSKILAYIARKVVLNSFPKIPENGVSFAIRTAEILKPEFWSNDGQLLKWLQNCLLILKSLL